MYGYGAKREWFNNEVEAFNADVNLVDRERFYVAHDQKLFGNVTDLTWNSDIAGMDNRLVTTFAASDLDFVRPGAANFPHDLVSLVDPARGTYGLLTTQLQTARIDNESLSFEDRLKITRTFALIGGVRFEHIGLDRNSTTVTGAEKRRFSVFQGLGAGDRPFRVHLGGGPRHDLLQPIRHRRRRLGQQHLPAGRDCSRWI